MKLLLDRRTKHPQQGEYSWGIRHLRPNTGKTRDTLALVWWVWTVRTLRNLCRRVRKTVATYVPNNLAPWSKVSHLVHLSVSPYFCSELPVALFQTTVYKERYLYNEMIKNAFHLLASLTSYKTSLCSHFITVCRYASMIYAVIGCLSVCSSVGLFVTKCDFAVFASKIRLLSKKVCYKVSLCENLQRKSCSYIIPLSPST